MQGEGSVLEDTCWPVLYDGRDSAGVLTDLMEKLCLKGRRKNLECICLLTSWLLFSPSQSWTHGQLASQPFQVATFSPFGILLESQSSHPAVLRFIQIQKRQEPSPPRAWSAPGTRTTWTLQLRQRQSKWLRVQEMVPSNSEEALKLLWVHFLWLSKPLSVATFTEPLALSLFSLWLRLLVSTTCESPLLPRHTGRWHFLPPCSQVGSYDLFWQLVMRSALCDSGPEHLRASASSHIVFLQQQTWKLCGNSGASEGGRLYPSLSSQGDSMGTEKNWIYISLVRFIW